MVSLNELVIIFVTTNIPVSQSWRRHEKSNWNENRHAYGANFPPRLHPERQRFSRPGRCHSDFRRRKWVTSSTGCGQWERSSRYTMFGMPLTGKDKGQISHGRSMENYSGSDDRSWCPAHRRGRNDSHSVPCREF